MKRSWNWLIAVGAVAIVALVVMLAVSVVTVAHSRDAAQKNADRATQTANEAVAELRALAASDASKIDALRSQISALGAVPVAQPSIVLSPNASGTPAKAVTPTTRPAQPVSSPPATSAPPSPPATSPPPTQPPTTTQPPAPCPTLPLIGCIP